MTPQSRQRINFEANIQALVDNYKITTTLYNIADSQSSINNKKIQLYQATVKSLSEASMIS